MKGDVGIAPTYIYVYVYLYKTNYSYFCILS